MAIFNNKNSLLCVCISFFYFILIYKKGEILWKKFGKILSGYEGKYQVSNTGKVKSLYSKNKYGIKNRERILKFGKNKNGYLIVSLSKNSRLKTFRVHRLVAEAFLNKIKGKDIVNHIDCNIENNNYLNLEYCTQKENMQYAWNLSRCEKSRINLENNVKNRRQKIKQLDRKENFIKQFNSMTEASSNLNIKYQNISACCRKKRKTAGGYIWRYADD